MAPSAEPDSWQRPYLAFAPTYLDHRRVSETPFLHNPDTNPPEEKSLLKRPLAASPQLVKFYSQYRCPICTATIAEVHGADFIGNLPCTHRATCTNPKCIRAYYGTEKKWASPYKKNKPLYCQASGCGKPIEGWCLVRAVMGNHAVFAIDAADPELERRTHEKRVKEEKKKEKEERKQEKEERKQEKEERK